MRELPIQCTDKVALIDDEDYERLKNIKFWIFGGSVARTDRHKVNIYDKSGNFLFRKRKTTHMSLARCIMQAPEGCIYDHIDRNPLNNQKSNLRLCTLSENRYNTSKQKGTTSSRYKGVHLQRGRWIATLTVDGKSKYLGRFRTERAAAQHYNAEGKKLIGEFFVPNKLSNALGLA